MRFSEIDRIERKKERKKESKKERKKERKIKKERKKERKIGNLTESHRFGRKGRTNIVNSEESLTQKPPLFLC